MKLFCRNTFMIPHRHCFLKGGCMTNEEVVIAIQTGSWDRRELLEQLYLQNAGMIEKVIRPFREQKRQRAGKG